MSASPRTQLLQITMWWIDQGMLLAALKGHWYLGKNGIAGSAVGIGQTVVYHLQSTKPC